MSSKHQEIWNITSALENHKFEITDWDLDAGIYIEYYLLRTRCKKKVPWIIRIHLRRKLNEKFLWPITLFIGSVGKQFAC
uniref:Uncharacterized protein n=1 Tax=Arundo donax TaxID=35708 RepID=A0A0A9H9G9_ARUDO